MKEKIKSAGIALALVICVGVTACDNRTEQVDKMNTEPVVKLTVFCKKYDPVRKRTGSLFM